MFSGRDQRTPSVAGGLIGSQGPGPGRRPRLPTALERLLQLRRGRHLRARTPGDGISSRWSARRRGTGSPEYAPPSTRAIPEPRQLAHWPRRPHLGRLPLPTSSKNATTRSRSAWTPYWFTDYMSSPSYVCWGKPNQEVGLVSDRAAHVGVFRARCGKGHSRRVQCPDIGQHADQRLLQPQPAAVSLAVPDRPKALYTNWSFSPMRPGLCRCFSCQAAPPSPWQASPKSFRRVCSPVWRRLIQVRLVSESDLQLALYVAARCPP